MKKSNIKFTGLHGEDAEGLHIAENESWNCEINDKEIPLCIIMEVLDMHGATGEPEFEQYPFIVSIGIIATKPHESFYEGEGEFNKLDLIYDCNGYMGSIPIEHKLLKIDSLNKNLMDELKSKSAKIVTQRQEFGAVAAQNGKGSEISYPQFKTAEAAYNFGQSLINNYGDILMITVGFVLDQPINMIGYDGWKQINTMIEGKHSAWFYQISMRY